jgi:hypothetical protein
LTRTIYCAIMMHIKWDFRPYGLNQDTHVVNTIHWRQFTLWLQEKFKFFISLYWHVRRKIFPGLYNVTNKDTMSLLWDHNPGLSYWQIQAWDCQKWSIDNLILFGSCHTGHVHRKQHSVSFCSISYLPHWLEPSVPLHGKLVF